MRGAPQALLLCALLLPTEANAHGFGRLYNLPVPFWLYAWGAAAALLLSFLLTGYFAASPVSGAAPTSRDISKSAFARGLRRARPALRTFSVFLLLLCIATACFGNRDPMRNFSMTFFWVVFLLGFTYLTALIGNGYESLNPWRTLTDLLRRLSSKFLPPLAGEGQDGGVLRKGHIAYPEKCGEWPALILYLAFIWYELFSHGKPAPLGQLLLAYTAINFAGAWLIGSAAWFRHCEFFSVFLRLIGHMAPLELEGGVLRLRKPFSGLTHARAASISTVVFAMAILSTTAFDGLRATKWWVDLFWQDRSGILTTLTGTHPILAYATLRPWYIVWESFWLFISPFLYTGAYLLCIAAARRVTQSTRSIKELALDFGLTLLPIALVYHLTHYATLLLSQGLKIISLASDPFGWGWNLLGTATLMRAPILPSMALVWHSQVALILLGHITSVYVAHRVALKVFPTRRQALLSQLPMLGLMMLFTVVGLWILAQPLTAEMMR